MKIVEGKLDYSFGGMSMLPLKDVLLFTGNATIKGDGGLVMGRGAAKEVRDTYPGIDVLLGKEIMKSQNDLCPSPFRTYGLAWVMAGWIRKARIITITMDPIPADSVEMTQLPRPIGVFQVKYNFRDQADRDLIDFSASKLGEIAAGSPERRFHINYPGIGNGHLTRHSVEPILLHHLPDNVLVYV